MINTLVIAPNWIGDALMAQPLLALLKQRQPQQSITVLAPAWVAPVVEAMPEVDRVIATAFVHDKLELRARRALAAELQRQRYDTAYILPNSFKSALVPWMARIPRRIGYRGESRLGVVNIRADNPPKSLPMVQRYAALASMMDGVDGSVATDPAREKLPDPHLSIAPDAIDSACAKFGLSRRQSLIVLCPGAEYGPAKRWPARHFAELAAKIFRRDRSAQVVLLGGKGDLPIADEIAASASTSSTPVRSGTAFSTDRHALFNLAGKTSLAEAIALIAAADTVVSNDSGLMHVAAALARPQVAIFGSSDPRHTPPLSARAEVLWLHLYCSPCFARTCPLGHLNCLNQIDPQQVMDRLTKDPTATLTALPEHDQTEDLARFA